MGRLLEIAPFKRQRRLKKRLETTQKALIATKKYYKEIEPLFHYKIMHDMGKEVLEFRRNLTYNIKELTKEIRIHDEK